MKNKNKKSSVSRAQVTPSLKKRDQFPMPICLEKCDLKVVQGFEEEVFRTLKSFSDKTMHNSNKPHPLHKEKKIEHLFKKADGEKVMSLDVGGRGGKRLYYYTDNTTGQVVCKILKLCSEESHSG